MYTKAETSFFFPFLFFIWHTYEILNAMLATLVAKITKESAFVHN